MTTRLLEFNQKIDYVQWEKQTWVFPGATTLIRVRYKWFITFYGTQSVRINTLVAWYLVFRLFIHRKIEE